MAPTTGSDARLAVGDPEIEPSRVLLLFHDSVPAQTPAFVLDLDASIVAVDDSIHFMVVSVDPANSLSLIERALADPRVASAEYDRYVYPTYTPTDILWGQEWGDAAVNLVDAWDVTLGSHDINIHILDTGVDVTHLDLFDNICSLGADMVIGGGLGGIGPGLESGFHGTHVAGIAGAAISNGPNGKLGVAGAAQACLHPVRVLAAESGLVSWVVMGILWSTNHDADIISMSLGSATGTTTLANAVDYADDNGVLVVAAAGNDNCGAVSFPAAYSDAMAVAALGTNGAKASYSSCGPEVDIAAPGSNIWSTLPGNTYGPLDGTSMATPLVAGIAALTWSANTTLTNSDIRCILEETAADLGASGHDNSYGWGRIDAYDAVVAASNPASVGC